MYGRATTQIDVLYVIIIDQYITDHSPGSNKCHFSSIDGNQAWGKFVWCRLSEICGEHATVVMNYSYVDFYTHSPSLVYSM